MFLTKMSFLTVNHLQNQKQNCIWDFCDKPLAYMKTLSKAFCTALKVFPSMHTETYYPSIQPLATSYHHICVCTSMLSPTPQL